MYLLMLITNHYSKDYVSGVYSLDRCLVKAYSQQTKEKNGATGKLDTADMIGSFVHSAMESMYITSYICKYHDITFFGFGFPVFPFNYFSSHPEPDSERIQGNHRPPPQADRHHVEGPLC